MRWGRWIASAAEVCIFLAGLAVLFTVDAWALTAWLVIGTLYLVGGVAAVWRGGPIDPEDVAAMPSVARWSWIPPVLAASIGVVSAVTALRAGSAGSGASDDLGLVVAASLGVILSWMLLQVGFAQMYLVLDLTGAEEDLRFPAGSTLSVLSYQYFAFTLGTSFATSDVEIVSVRMRRLALLHAVVAFFYDALVVAVAFQVLQGAVTR
ncbi:DUF1345 domain-containing protein [Pimelobacter simplex]|uniref:DUF1345 domain-containing protein n=1 Tax=Nocardioides simplex TaxID=2045 RepID=UPI0037FC8519